MEVLSWSCGYGGGAWFGRVGWKVREEQVKGFHGYFCVFSPLDQWLFISFAERVLEGELEEKRGKKKDSWGSHV